MRVILLAFLGGLPFLLAGAESDHEKLHRIFAEGHAELLRESPETATLLLGRSEYDHRWRDLSPESIERFKASRRRRLEDLKEIDPAKLEPDDRFNLDLFENALRLRVEADRFPGELLAVDAPNRGPAITVPNVLQQMHAETIQDYHNILARLEAAPVLIEQTIALLDRGLREGITQPQVVVLGVLPQLDALVSADPGQGPLAAPFRRFPASIPEPEQVRLAGEARAILDRAVYPAFRKLRDYLVSTYIPGCRTSLGLSALPDGQEWYTHEIRRHTTTALSPEQIHAMGLSEVQRIHGEMDAVIREVKFGGSVPEFIRFLRTDSRFYFAKPEDLLTAYRDLCKRIDPELPRLFGRLPRAPYGVRAVPDHIAPSYTSGRYWQASASGSRPGYFMVNTYKLESRPRYEMEALAFHEAVPGHHLQIALALELEHVPEFRKALQVNAFVEGWALYAESLGEELGLYRDPYSRFGRLSFDMWRACRLVVDTGIHALEWPRERAIEFMKANSALSEHNIISEVDRYIAWPGQALGYKIGELRIKALRRQAEQALGPGFDIRAFHDTVLANGAVPLDILERQVQAWIARQTAAAGTGGR